MATSVDVMMQADFAMRYAIDLMSTLNGLRCYAEYVLCGEEEFPQEDLKKYGEEVLELASSFVQEIEKLREMISTDHKGPNLTIVTQDPQDPETN